MNPYPETPDNWIERRPEDIRIVGDRCEVCGAYDDCYCPDDTPDEREADYNRSQFGQPGR